MIDQIRKIRRDFSSLQLDDQATLIQIGAQMQELVAQLPSEASAASELLMLCLHGLQAIYQHTYTDFSQLQQAIDMATAAAEQMLAAPENPIGAIIGQQAQQNLQQHLAQLAAPSAPANSDSDVEITPTANEIPSLQTLDDISAFLMQLQPHDQPALVHIAEALKMLVTQGGLTPEVKKPLVKAGKAAEQLVRGKAKKPAEAFAQITQLLTEAALAQEFTTEEAQPAKAAPDAAPDAPLHQATVEKADITKVTPQQPPAITSSEATSASSTAQDFGCLPADADLALMGEFVVESCEYMEGAEAALLALEHDPDDLESVNTVFRAFHTIKGTSAFLGLDKISALAHLAESLLSRVRDREIRCTGGYADLALRSADMLKELLESITPALHGAPLKKPATYDELMHLLTNPEAAGISAETSASALAQERVTEPKLDVTTNVAPVVTSIATEVAPSKVTEPTIAAPQGTVSNTADNTKRAQTRAQQNERSEESFMRVRTNRLDRLIDMVGELVIAHAMIAQDETVLATTHQDLARKTAHAGKIIRELQDLSMGMRMVPLKATFQKMARLVRDVAQKSGKLVEFVTEGEDTEIDRNMADVVGDPLIHMIRNAVDHGIETPADRLAKGKPKQGTVHLAAYHAGGEVVVELRDDGGGLNRDKIVRKAIEKGLIESDKNLSNSEVYNLIFAPGFSTAEKVSDISGRGVGMDVVRRNVEALRGRVHISSEPNKGCTFTVRLPLTLAITDGMLIKVGTECYIIPTVNIHLSFRPLADALSTIAGRGEMVALRGELMPLFRLHHLFDVQGAIEDPTKGLIVVVADGRRRCALLVDELLGQQQVVAKSLGSGISKVQGISGGAILGDGRVGLILDVPEVVALARQITSAVDRKDALQQATAANY